MRDRFSPLLWGTAAVIAVGCGGGADVTSIDDQTPSDGDPFAKLLQDLSQLSTPCVYSSSARQLTVTMAANEVALIKRNQGSAAPTDDFVTVNGFDCAGTTVPAGSGNTPVQKVTVTGSTGNESVILDFTDGPFAFGTAATNGITVDLAGGTADMLGIRMGALADTVTYGSSGIAIVNASAPADTFKDITATNVEFNKIMLGAGNDTISASGNTASGGIFVPTGTLELYGGDGNDTFSEGSAKTFRELISGGNGSDSIDYSSRTGGLNVTVSTTSVASANDGDLSSTAGNGPENDDIKDDIESIIGTPGNDILSGGGSQGMLLIGGAGNDTLSGGLGADTLNGGAGNDLFIDTISSSTTGADVFIGSDGIDTIDYSGRTGGIVCSLDGTNDDGEAGEGDNVGSDIENIVGGAGADILTGSSKNNIIIGGLGADSVHGGGGLDTMSYSNYTAGVVAFLAPTTSSSDSSQANGVGGVTEGDWIFGDIENLTGGLGNDSLVGNSGPNELVGGTGNDSLTGGAGDDVLEGGAAGNTESNVLDCGAGDDIGFSQGSGAGASKLDCEF